VGGASRPRPELDARVPSAGVEPTERLDLRTEVCPYTFLRAKLALEGLEPGQVLEVIVDNPLSAQDVPRSLDRSGHTVLSVTPLGAGAFAIVVQKGR